jgi:hypothetical protein
MMDIECFKNKNNCKCDVTDPILKGVVCRGKDGCKYKSDCAYAKENQDKIMDEIPCEDAQETGSWVICNPPVTDTDEDWIFDCSENGQMKESEKVLKKHGFWIADMAEDEYDDIRENFTPFRLGHLNFILCNNRKFFRKFVFATALAQEMNLLKKKDRILLFQGILYNKINGEKY